MKSDQQKKTLFISWIRSHGRSSGLSRALDAEELNIYPESRGTLIRYIKSFFITIKHIRSKKPTAVIVMQPPAFAALPVFIARFFGPYKILLDLHTGAFDNPKWKWALPILLKLLPKTGRVIVTNKELAAIVRRYNREPIVLHDLIEPAISNLTGGFDDSDLDSLIQNRYVLLPVTYAYDEPIDELLEAAQIVSDLTWIFTGRAPSNVVSKAPRNVIFPGFVSNNDYIRLLQNATIVVAPTTAENTMQRAGYEALSYCVPLVTTKTKVLMEYFEDAAVYASISGASFAKSVRKASDRQALMKNKLQELYQTKLASQTTAIQDLQNWIIQ